MSIHNVFIQRMNIVYRPQEEQKTEEETFAEEKEQDEQQQRRRNIPFRDYQLTHLQEIHHHYKRSHVIAIYDRTTGTAMWNGIYFEHPSKFACAHKKHVNDILNIQPSEIASNGKTECKVAYMNRIISLSELAGILNL